MYAKESVEVMKRCRSNNELNQEQLSKSRLKTTVLLFLLSLLAIGTATLAWFTLNSFAAVDNMEMSIGTGTQLLVSTKNHGTDLSKYTSEITNEMIDAYLQEYNVKLANFKLMPVTTSDGVKFYNQGGAQKTENTESFLEYDLYFISSSDLWVHLTSDNSSAQEKDGTAVTTTTAGAPEVVQAVRIGFTNPSGTKIYEPNKGSAVGGQITFDLPSPMQYTNNTRLFQLKAMTPTKVTVRVWIEGEDPQCKDNIQLAQLGIRLAFKGTDENNEVVG